jgi:hypothetical protein
MNNYFQCLIALAVVYFVSLPSTAEMTASGKFDFKLFSVKGAVISDRVVVDNAFGKKHGINIRAPFEFHVPRIKGVRRYARYAKELNGSDIKIIFGTEKEEFIESIQLNGFTVKADHLKERRRQSASYLKNVVWKQITEKQGDRKIDVFRNTTVNGLPAVELIGRYVDILEKENGTLLARLVAVLREDSDQGIIATINIAKRFVDVSDDKEMAETVSAWMLNSVKFN